MDNNVVGKEPARAEWGKQKYGCQFIDKQPPSTKQTPKIPCESFGLVLKLFFPNTVERLGNGKGASVYRRLFSKGPSGNYTKGCLFVRVFISVCALEGCILNGNKFIYSANKTFLHFEFRVRNFSLLFPSMKQLSPSRSERFELLLW